MKRFKILFSVFLALTVLFIGIGVKATTETTLLPGAQFNSKIRELLTCTPEIHSGFGGTNQECIYVTGFVRENSIPANVETVLLSTEDDPYSVRAWRSNDELVHWNSNADTIYMNSDYNQTPHVSKTPNNVYINSIAMSEYDNTNGFTPGLEAPSVTSMWHNPGSVYNGTISTPEPGKMAPSSPEYNPKSEYYKSPAPYSPMANDENNRGQSQYGVSAYSPSMNSPYASGMAGLNSRKYQQTGNRGINSTYSPTTPGNMRPSSSSPGYIQGSGSGLYNSTPLVQGSGNTSQYRPASPNPYPTSPTYNINSLNSASPFYNTNKENNDDDEEEEEEEEENNDKDKKNN